MVKIVKMEINGAPPVEFDCSLQDKLPTISFQISRVQYEVVPDHYVSYVEEKLENALDILPILIDLIECIQSFLQVCIEITQIMRDDWVINLAKPAQVT